MDVVAAGFSTTASCQERPACSFGANSVTHRRVVGSKEVTEQTFLRQLGTGTEAQGLSGEIDMDSVVLPPDDTASTSRKVTDDAAI